MNGRAPDKFACPPVQYGERDTDVDRHSRCPRKHVCRNSPDGVQKWDWHTKAKCYAGAHPATMPARIASF